MDELRADLELGILVDKRPEKNVASEEERQALWAGSVGAYYARRRWDLRLAWCAHYRRMKAVHWGLRYEYDAKLRELGNRHEKENSMSETKERTLEEELREVERETESMERELAEREQPLVWGEVDTEEVPL